MRAALVMCHADRSMAGAMRELNFSKYLGEFGVEVEVFRIFKGAEPEEESFLRGRIKTRFFPPDIEEAVPHRLVSTQLADAIRAFAPDVIIFKGLSYAIAAFVHERLPDIPYGFIVGGSVRDTVLEGARFIFGEYTQQLDNHFQAHSAAGRTYVLPKYIDPVLAAMERAAEPAYDIVNVGNFHEKRKNQKDVLPFAANWRIALVGGDKLPEEWEPLVPNPDNVKLLGRLKQDGVFAALLNARIMVHTSTMDGLPRSMIESMAAGTPVIAYRETIYGGIVEGEHGFLVTPDTLAHAVELLLREETLRQEMSSKARAYAEKFHGLNGLRKTAKMFAEELRTRLLA